MDITAIALSGMEAAQQSVQTAAQRLASPGHSGARSISAPNWSRKRQYAANEQVIKTDLFA
jgi:hypothetical protein